LLVAARLRTFDEPEECAVEFLADMTTNVPPETPQSEVDDTKRREAIRAAELEAQGHLLRLWKPPLQRGEWRTLGLWVADDEDQMHHILASLPLHKWMTVALTPLAPHPNDPGTSSG
jgi:muconolactone delta-isomerase